MELNLKVAGASVCVFLCACIAETDDQQNSTDVTLEQTFGDIQ